MSQDKEKSANLTPETTENQIRIKTFWEELEYKEMQAKQQQQRLKYKFTKGH